jgi:hypothetical protein
MIDDHAHPFSLQGGPLDLSALSLDIEPDPDGRRARLGPGRVFQELLAVRLARYLKCQPDEVSEARAEASTDWPAYVAGLFADAGIRGLVMDPAYPPGAAEQLDEYARLSGCTVHALLRIDTVVDRMIGEEAGAAEIVSGVTAAMQEAASIGFAGFKTILAYRTGLAVDPQATMREAEASLRSELPVRRRGKVLRDLVLREALGVAADLRRPFQIHTGVGDSEIRLAEANPLLLEELLRSPPGQAARIVLIHGSFPWIDELAFLTLTKPNVWADVSLFNIFSPLTSADRVVRLIDLAPAGKILMGTDGYHEPELFWFAGGILRKAWDSAGRRLEEAGARPSWIQGVERMMFTENARELYGI